MRQSAGAWSNGAGAWQMKFAERRPFSASDDAENGSKIANRNSLWEELSETSEALVIEALIATSSSGYNI